MHTTKPIQPLSFGEHAVFTNLTHMPGRPPMSSTNKNQERIQKAIMILENSQENLRKSFSELQIKLLDYLVENKECQILALCEKILAIEEDWSIMELNLSFSLTSGTFDSLKIDGNIIQEMRDTALAIKHHIEAIAVLKRVPGLNNN